MLTSFPVTSRFMSEYSFLILVMDCTKTSIIQLNWESKETHNVLCYPILTILLKILVF